MSLILEGWDAGAQHSIEFTAADLNYSVAAIDDGPPLLAVVVQDAHTGVVLMTAFADEVAVERTVATGFAWFWSRSRRRLWQKGETSGNVLEVLEARVDCDADALLLRVLPAGPACHRGTVSCFMPSPPGLELGWLHNVLRQRQDAGAEGSYTARLLARGVERVAQKVGEEGVETVIAALHRSFDETASEAQREEAVAELVGESADLLYHLMVLLLARGIEPQQLARELGRRHARRTAEEGS